MAKRKKKKRTEVIGEITALDALKASQPWLGNQRSHSHKSIKDYNRKKKHPKRDWNDLRFSLRGKKELNHDYN